jgi:hypothetical protein
VCIARCVVCAGRVSGVRGMMIEKIKPPLMKLLAIRLGCQKTTAKSLVIAPPCQGENKTAPPLIRGGWEGFVSILMIIHG